MWTSFMDMHSGGKLKEKKYKYIYIEAPKEEAIKIFYNRFGHNPDRVSCTCCGEDYSIDEKETLEQVTAFQRGCRYAYFKDGQEISEHEGWKVRKGLLPGVTAKYVEEGGGRWSFNKYIQLKNYLKQKNILIIYKDKIKKKERQGAAPEQGFVWQD